MRILDLFSGLNGWTAPSRYDEVLRIDNDKRFEADAYIDINDIDDVIAAWNARFGDEPPDIILASPPCNSFSTMTMGRMWTHEGLPKHPLAVEGQRNVLSTLKIIAILRPQFWIIENPRARLRSLDLLSGVSRRTVTQCQYGTKRMKPTDLWGVFPEGLELRPLCKNGDDCHVRAPRGSTSGTQGMDRYESARIPYDLAKDILTAADREVWVTRPSSEYPDPW